MRILRTPKNKIKISFIIFILSCCVFLNSCTFENNTHTYPKQEANKILDTLLIALENDDKQSLKNLFAFNVQEQSENLDTQIDEIINYFNGDVISYDKLSINAEGESIDDGVITYYRIGNARTGKVITNEATYIISFSAIIIDEDNKDNEGIWRIWIGKDEKDYMIVGISDMPLT